MKRVTSRGTGNRAKDFRGGKVRSALEIAMMQGSFLPRSLKFDIPDPEPKPDPKPDPIEERLTAMQAMIDAADAKANAAQAELRRLKKEPAGDPPDPKPKPGAGAEKELADRVAVIEARAATTARNAKRNGLKSAFSEVGLSGEDLNDAIDLFMVRSGDKLEYDDATDSVRVRDSEVDEPKELSEYIGAQAKAGKFKRFKAAPDVPRKGPASGNNGVRRGDGLAMTLKEFQESQRRGDKLDLNKVRIED